MAEFRCGSCGEIIEISGALHRCPDCLAWADQHEAFDVDATLVAET